MPRRAKVRGPLPPGSTIGILGSGQLARMLSTAASRLGLKTHIYSDVPGSASDVAARTTIAGYDDVAALDAFARSVDVVTYEFENVPDATAAELAKFTPVRPGPKALAVSQDRLTEKTFIRDLGLGVAPFAPIERAEDIAPAVASLGGPCILKTRRLGYDGKGQVSLASDDAALAARAFKEIRGAPAVVEKRLSFAQELSVICVRAGDGSVRHYDIPQNTHGGGILRRSVVPAPLDPGVADRAYDIATRIAVALDYVGVLAVELFDLGSGVPVGERLLVNEIAPRVHNSGHWTIDACPVSQFENHIRAVADWPLGDAERHSDAEMFNLIGEEVNAWRDLAGDPDVALHIYDKGEARDGRKMGHWTRLFPRGTRGAA